MLLAIVALIVWVVAAYFAITGQRGFGLKLGQRPAPTSRAAGATASAEPLAPPPSSPVAAASSATPETAPKDVGKCVRGLFAPSSFTKGSVDFAFLCKSGDLRRSGGEIKKALLKARRGSVTQGMREWAGLGWYEVAAVALLRSQCCASRPPIRFKLSPVCPIEQALTELESAFENGERKTVDEAVSGYRVQARCIYQSGQAANFGQDAPPGSGRNALYRFIERVDWPKAD